MGSRRVVHEMSWTCPNQNQQCESNEHAHTTLGHTHKLFIITSFQQKSILRHLSQVKMELTCYFFPQRHGFWMPKVLTGAWGGKHMKADNCLENINKRGKAIKI